MDGSKGKKNWVRKFNSFEEAEEADRDDYFKMSPSERLDVMQKLREMQNGRQKGLQKVFRIIN